VAYAEALWRVDRCGCTKRCWSLRLRRFEFALLEELGYSVDLTREAHSNEAVVADAAYALVPDYGLRRVTTDDGVGAEQAVSR
jgi:recombinational DNA repair protein (RecF pathway)